MDQLDEVKRIYETLDVPHLSLDYAYDGKHGYVIEIQAVHFGTSTLDFCDGFYTFDGKDWVIKKQTLDQEGEYVYALKKYFEKHPELVK